MFDICPNCGLYTEEKVIEPEGPYAVCPECDYRHRFVSLPLFVLTGASGAGKSTVCLTMAAHLQACVWLETDILWGPAFDTPENNDQPFHNACLRTAKNINQSGRPTVLCGSATPGQYERCPQVRYFSEIHMLALVCTQSELRRRLMSRPANRNSASDEFVERMVAYNQWFYDHQTGITLLDTTNQTLRETCETVGHWLAARLL